VSHIGKIADATQTSLRQSARSRFAMWSLTRPHLENTAAIARAVLSDVETIHYACWVIPSR